MNIQSKMKTRDAKNNPVTAVLVSVLVMFLLSCLFLLLKDHENTEIFMGICSGSHLFLHFIPDISVG